MSEPVAPSTYATAADVRIVLGALGSRPGLPDIDPRLSMAHAEVLDRLSDVYGPTLPVWRASAAEAVRWAEAKLAAADLLDVLRATRDDDSTVAEKLRASAYATISGGLPGQRPGDASTSPDTPPGATPPTLPLLSSTATLSNFPDPYASDLEVWP